MPNHKAQIGMVGSQFHQLKVLQRSSNSGTAARYECECSCGATCLVQARHLRSGKVKSCGCRKVGYRGGPSGHPLHDRWVLMHKRCYDPGNNRYHRYGGRGIIIESRWHSFEKYLEDVMPSYVHGLTLDRIDNDGNYGPDNFRWATYTTQARNKDQFIAGEENITKMQELYVNSTLTQAEVGERFGFGRELVKHYLRNLRARIY